MAAPVTWSFTTDRRPAARARSGRASATPAIAVRERYPGGRAGREVPLGRAPASITGVRFYKGAGNTGTHVGNLWTSRRHAARPRATFTSETATGWQQVTSPTPVAITREHDLRRLLPRPERPLRRRRRLLRHGRRRQRPAARAGQRRSGGQRRLPLRRRAGSRPDSYRRPTTGSTWSSDDRRHRHGRTDDRRPAPAADATGVAVTSGDGDVQRDRCRPATIPVDAARRRRRDGPGRVSYDAASRTATLNPTASLATRHDLHRHRQRSGRPGRQPSATPASPGPFTDGRPAPARIWAGTATPADRARSGHRAVRAGRQVPRPTSPATSPGCASTRAPATPAPTSAPLDAHRRRSWPRATFTGETATGWQQVTLRHAGRGHGQHDLRRLVPRPERRLRLNAGYFATAASTAGRCTRWPAAVDGGNGVYRYGAERRSRPRPTARPTTGSTSSSRRPRRRPDTTAPTISAVQAGRASPQRRDDHLDHRRGRRQPGRVRPDARGYGVAGPTLDAAPGDQPLERRSSGLTPSTLYHYRGQEQGRRRQPGHLRRLHVHDGRRSPRPARARSGRPRDAGSRLGRGHHRVRAGRQVPRGRRPATSRACASTRGRATPAPTSATSGRATGTKLATRHLHRRDRDRLAAGHASPRRSRSRPTRPTSRRTTPRTAASPRTRATSPTTGVDSGPLHALAEPGQRRQRRLQVRPERLPRPDLQRRPTTGSTSCSRRRRPRRDTTAPTISAVQAGSITSSGATITWTTNEASDSQVEYGRPPRTAPRRRWHQRRSPPTRRR